MYWIFWYSRGKLNGIWKSHRKIKLYWLNLPIDIAGVLVDNLIFYELFVKRLFEIFLVSVDFVFGIDSVQDSYEEQEFWMTRLDWVGIQLNQFEIFEEHENCLSRWKKMLF